MNKEELKTILNTKSAKEIKEEILALEKEYELATKIEAQIKKVNELEELSNAQIKTSKETLIIPNEIIKQEIIWENEEILFQAEIKAKIFKDYANKKYNQEEETNIKVKSKEPIEKENEYYYSANNKNIIQKKSQVFAEYEQTNKTLRFLKEDLIIKGKLDNNA